VLNVPPSLSSSQTPEADSERADVALASSGDAQAFERLYRQHVPRIHSLVRRMVGSQGDPDEVTQDVFVRAWQRLKTFRGESAFGTWLHRLAINLMLGQRATLGTERKRYQEGEGLMDRLSARPASPDFSMDFEDAMERLPDGAREIFVLHDIEGYKHEEIARMLGIVAGTSKAQLHRARMALRNHLDR